MWPRPASHGSRLCTGILLVFVSTSLVKSQISASLDLSRPSTTSGNSTVLNRISQEEDNISPSTSSNGERKLAFQSPITRSAEPSEWLENSSDITSELYSNNNERPLLNNRDLLETTSAYHSQVTSVTSFPIIDLEESTGPNEVTKKHLMGELRGEGYSIIKENQNVKISEFNEHIDYSDIEDNDKLGNREPTTTKIPRGNDGRFSLINDTNVNYKAVRAKEHVEEDAMITMNLKITQENATNIISGESNIDDKSKIPKCTHVEIIKNVTTGLKPMRITEFDEFGKKLYKNMSSKATTPMSLSIITDIFNKKDDSIIKNNESNDDNYKKSERNSLLKGRTISFSGINQFSNTEVKAAGSTQEASSDVEFIKEIKPYPYLKSSTINSLNSSKQLGGSSIEELSALENTIGKSPDMKKLVITESSAVIDNSIQQLKPNNVKRSGNLSRMSNLNATSSLSSVTLRPRELIEGKNSPTTQSITSDKTVNIIPMNHDGVIERKSSLDLSSNGLTENVENNKTILNESRATETNLVQNSTEIVASSDEVIETATNRDIQTSAEDSMLLVSSLNVTEDSTKIPTTIKSNSNESTSSTTTFIVPLTSTIIPDKIFDDDTITTATTTADIPQTTLNPVIISSITSKSLLPSPTTKTKSTSFSESVLIGNDSTTSSGVEYEFIGLTESTVSSSYISNSDTTSKTLTTDVTEFTSNSSDTSTTIWSTDSSTASSIIQDLSSEINSDNLTVLTTIIPDDLMTTSSSMPDEFLSTTENSLDTTIYTTSEYTDMPYPDETTIIQEETTYPEFKISNESKSNTSSSIDSINPTIPLITTSTTMRTEIITSNITNVTSPSGPSNTAKITPGIEIIPVTLSIGNSTSGTNTGSPAVNIVTNVQPFSPEDVNLLVRIVVEDTWNDICANLSDLRQSLADLLTAGIEKTVLAIQIIFQKNPCMEKLQENIASPELTLSTLYLYVVNQNGNFDAPMTRILPSLYSSASIKSQLTIRSIQLVQDSDSGNAIAVVVVSCVALICLVLLAGLLFIMRKRQTRFNYGERCRPVSLDAFSLDSVSAYNSVRRKGANRASKRSYGNPTFEDSTAIPSHPLNFTGLSTFCNEQNTIYEEFSGIPQVSARIDELPPGAEVKNRYANVIPLPETRVQLLKINDDPLSDYINASYVRGPKNATKYYIACQSPIESTVTDFWRMIWEQQSKVIIMLTDLVENGAEKCAEYIPPSEVTDCHRLYGDYQVTLKKRETKEKYAISTLHLKNLENNTYREISHIWYLWPVNGVQTDAAGLIAVLLEARALQRGGPTPIVVHCSPGTGRTGTLIALDLAIRQYEITRTVDVPRVVYTIRRDRAGAVQTKEQYAFIYKALNLYATKLAGGGLEST